MIKIIVAVDKNGAIGKDNDLLYYIKEDLKNFKEITEGNVVVMGRNTWDSLPIKPLPNRQNVILTNSDNIFEGADVLHSLDEVKKLKSTEKKDVYVIGGASVYNQSIEDNIIDEAHITFVNDEYEGADVFVNIEKLKKSLPKEEYIKEFDQDGLKADYVIFSR